MSQWKKTYSKGISMLKVKEHISFKFRFEKGIFSPKI